MVTPTRAAIAAYISAMLCAFTPGSAAGRTVVDWLRDHRNALDIDVDALSVRRGRSGRKRKPPAADQPLPKPAWLRLRTAVARAAAGETDGSDTVAANIAAFARATGLDELEVDVFRFVLHTDRDKAFAKLCSGLVQTRALDTLALTAVVLDRSPTEIWDRLRRGQLNALRLVENVGDGGTRFAFYVPRRILQAMLPPSSGLADIERRLIGSPLLARLGRDRYGHIARERDFILRLLQGALAARRTGVNILIYGPPGTGKSEFCKMAAHQLGCDLFAVGEADEDGDEPSRADRLDALRLADRLASRRGKALLLFDEMEDILQHGDRGISAAGPLRRAGSKVFFNRLLERNEVPVLWTTNAVEEFDPAFLRRMTFCLEMKMLPAGARVRFWEELARGEGLQLPAPEAEALARRHRVSPSTMAGALQAVTMAGGTADEIDFAVRSLAGPIQGSSRAEAPPPASFRPELVNADLDLARFERAIASPTAARNFSLCLYGPPGTGKSAFARHLAGVIGMDPLLKRGSDLLSKWVGESERLVAEAFAEARHDRRFLIIDEAETFLWSRDGASHSWEASLVNELLVEMEAHPLPFACTTNHLRAIDTAALRRFTFKVKFDFITAGQTAEAFRRFFDREPPPALRDLSNLTPGDFAIVAKKLRFLGLATAGDAEILHFLEQEAAARNLPARRIGF